MDRAAQQQSTCWRVRTGEEHSPGGPREDEKDAHEAGFFYQGRPGLPARLSGAAGVWAGQVEGRCWRHDQSGRPIGYGAVVRALQWRSEFGQLCVLCNGEEGMVSSWMQSLEPCLREAAG